MLNGLVQTGWDEGSRFRQRRLLVMVVGIVLVGCVTYLIQWDQIHEPREAPSYQYDPGRNESLARCC